MVQSPVAQYLKAFSNSRHLGRLIVYSHVEDARPARMGRLSIPLPHPLEQALRGLGIKELYSHQVQAINLIRQGHHVIVATPTASGKSLVYNLPILEQIALDPRAKALYLFPLKALAQDQLRNLQLLINHLGDSGPCPDIAIYDGDTNSYRRGKIRARPPACLFTNPDMLHLSLLPYHDKWSAFFRDLRFVVIDEVHTYRGIMGSNMAWVFRRLKRICHHYGSSPTFILSSATIGNPLELAQGLTGLDFELIDKGGAPQGKRHLLMVDPQGSGAAQVAVQLILAAMHRGLRTICYTQSRKLTELIGLWVCQRAGALKDKVSAYRAGFLPEERRQVERDLTTGKLLSVISTSALELGIDIGELDICILVGYPGTLTSLRQRSGRVGRSARESAVILVAGEDALDRYFLEHPRELLDRPSEEAVIGVANRKVIDKHLVCAATELPIHVKEPILQDKVVKGQSDLLLEQGRLFLDAKGERLVSLRRFPHREVDLRGTGRGFQIIDLDNGRTIGSVDSYRAFKETHPGAIYLHRGETFQVEQLDLETQRVLARRVKVNYFTRVRSSKETEIIKCLKRRHVFAGYGHWGRLLITDQVIGYDVLHVRGQRLINRVDLDLPPQRFETEGIWITIPQDIKAQIEASMYHFMGGIHALEHACIGVMPLLVLCDRNDLGGISITFHPQLSKAAVFIFDSIPGGVGLTEKAFESLEELIDLTLRTIKGCPCENGCPSCVHSPKCGSGNRPIDKRAALSLLELLITGSQKSTANKSIIRRPATGTRGAKSPHEFKPSHGVRPTRSIGLLSSFNEEGGRFGVLDIETQRSAQEVGGWHRADKMKVSCAVLFDSKTRAFTVFLEDQLPYLFSLLNKMDLIVGFNIKRFDYKVLSGYSSMDFWGLPTFDILEDVHRRLGYRLSLDALASSTLGAKKSANGLLALRWWKEGRIRDIIQYCKQDVALTRDLFLFGRKNQYLLFKNKAKNIVRLPVDW